MNADQLFTLLNETNDSYLKAAHKSMTEKPARTWFHPALIAACLTLVLLAIPVGILIGNRTITPNVPIISPSTESNTVITTKAPETTEKPKASILDIPGATVFDENDNRFYNEGRPSSYTDLFSEERTREILKHIKRNNSIVIGFIQDYTTVLVEDGEDYYQMTTMTIQVLEKVIGIEEKTVTAVYACRYYNENGRYRPAGTYHVPDSIKSPCDQFKYALICTQAYVAQQGNAAGFILLKESKDQTLLIDNAAYNLSDYADYVLDACLGWANWGSLFLNLGGGGYYPIPSSFVEEAFNQSFATTYPCPYEYPFSYPLEVPSDRNAIFTPES